MALQGKRAEKKRHNKRIRFDYTFKNERAGIKDEFKEPIKAAESRRRPLGVIYLSKVRLITAVQAGQLINLECALVWGGGR